MKVQIFKKKNFLVEDINDSLESSEFKLLFSLFLLCHNPLSRSPACIYQDSLIFFYFFRNRLYISIWMMRNKKTINSGF